MVTAIEMLVRRRWNQSCCGSGMMEYKSVGRAVGMVVGCDCKD